MTSPERIASPPPLSPLRRLLWLSAGWGLYVLSGPGVLFQGGSAIVAFVGVAIWALSARRPGRFRLLLEAAVAGLALAGEVWWVTYVYIPPIVIIFLGFGVYGALRGVLLRIIGAELRASIAVPLAWIGPETVRMTAPEPAGFGWMALGHHAAFTPILSESARLWGELGLGFVLAALAGFAVELFEARRGWGPAASWRSFAFGLGPLAVGLLAAFVFPVPASEPGPLVVCVQPGFPQWRKMEPMDPNVLFAEQLEFTRRAVAAAPETPDLVCWGETMLSLAIPDPALVAAIAAGEAVEVDPWFRLPESGLAGMLTKLARLHREWVVRRIFGLPGGGGVLPPGTAFASGATYFKLHEGRLRKMNAVLLWGPDAEYLGYSAKRNLVPGAESLLGLEKFEFTRQFILDISTYIPDYLAAKETGVLAFRARDGRTYRFGGSVCYDNAVAVPYLEPLRHHELDFHLVASNEAWYGQSWEADQMMAFSRLLCIESGRSMVRATNSGISCAFGPDGSEIARLSVDGRDRIVEGSLAVRVPVPVADGAQRAPRPPYVWLEPYWRWAAMLLPFAIALWIRRRTVTQARKESRPRHPGGGLPSA